MNLLPLVLAATLRVGGSSTLGPVAVEAGRVLFAEKKLEVRVDFSGGSGAGIAGIRDGSLAVGLSSKPVSSKDRKQFRLVRFTETQVAGDAVALVVSPDVYDGGVQALTREKVKEIYEKKITRWKDLGGPDTPITFFCKEPTRGTWEVLAHWLYGHPRLAPRVHHPQVRSNDQTRSKVAGEKGALAALSSAWTAGSPAAGLRVLGLQAQDGGVLLPTPENVASGRYPMSRPLFVVTNGPPRGNAKVFVDFLLGKRGQELLKKHGFLRLADLKR